MPRRPRRERLSGELICATGLGRNSRTAEARPEHQHILSTDHVITVETGACAGRISLLAEAALDHPEIRLVHVAVVVEIALVYRKQPHRHGLAEHRVMPVAVEPLGVLSIDRIQDLPDLGGDPGGLLALGDVIGPDVNQRDVWRRRGSLLRFTAGGAIACAT